MDNYKAKIVTDSVSAQTDYAVSAGEFIEEWLNENNMTQAELTLRMGLSPRYVSRLIAGVPLTDTFAMGLELVTGVPAQIWLSFEKTYRNDVKRIASKKLSSES